MSRGCKGWGGSFGAAGRAAEPTELVEKGGGGVEGCSVQGTWGLVRFQRRLMRLAQALYPHFSPPPCDRVGRGSEGGREKPEGGWEAMQ